MRTGWRVDESGDYVTVTTDAEDGFFALGVPLELSVVCDAQILILLHHLGGEAAQVVLLVARVVHVGEVTLRGLEHHPLRFVLAEAHACLVTPVAEKTEGLYQVDVEELDFLPFLNILCISTVVFIQSYKYDSYAGQLSAWSVYRGVALRLGSDVLIPSHLVDG
jgi:hypothetical protein